jgi:hypothetical protein
MIWIVILLSIAYNTYIVWKYKRIPESLSETSYMLGKDKWLFISYCVITGGLMLPLLLDITPENFQCFPFFICGGLIMAGASPLYRNGLDKYVHYVSAMFAFISFLIYLGIYNWLMLLQVVLLLCLYYIAIDKKTIIYSAEIVALIYLIDIILH